MPETAAGGTPEERLEALGLTLPDPAVAVGSYAMYVRTGPWLQLAGHGAFDRGRPTHLGRVGRELSTEEGAIAARDAMLGLLATVRGELGSLSAVARFVRVAVYVRSAPGFAEQHLVANGATDLLVRVFGDAIGSPARTALGVAELPLGFAVELDAVVEVRGGGSGER